MTTTTTDYTTDNTVTINEDQLSNIRPVSLKTLRKLNKESVKRGYNRNIWVKEFEKSLKEVMDKSSTVTWRGFNTTVLLTPLMIHEHKNLEPCEPHVRCRITTGMFEKLDPFLDVPWDMFWELESVTSDLVEDFKTKVKEGFFSDDGGSKTSTPQLVVDNT